MIGRTAASLFQQLRSHTRVYAAWKISFVCLSVCTLFALCSPSVHYLPCAVLLPCCMSCSTDAICWAAYQWNCAAKHALCKLRLNPAKFKYSSCRPKNFPDEQMGGPYPAFLCSFALKENGEEPRWGQMLPDAGSHSDSSLKQIHALLCKVVAVPSSL